MPAPEIDRARTVPLRRLAGFTRGLSYSSSDYGSEGEGVPFINLKCVGKGGGFSGRGLKWFVGAVDPKSRVAPGDLLLANTDLTPGGQVVGSPLMVPDEIRGASISLDLTRLLIDDSAVNRQYLFYALSGIHARIFMKGAARGTTVLHLELDRAKDCPIWLPSLAEQRAIADYLDTETARIDAVIVRKQQLIRALEERLSTVVERELAGGSWPRLRLKHVCRGITVGVVVNPSSYFVDDGVPFIHGTDIRRGWIDTSRLKFLSAESNALLLKSQVRTGDVVAMRVGEPGRAAVVPPELDGSKPGSAV